MKLSLLAGVAVTAMLLAAPQASAHDYKPYVSLFGGGAWLTDKMHTTYTGYSSGSEDYTTKGGYIIGGAVGAEWNHLLRTELELSHASWNLDKQFYFTYDGSPDGSDPADGNVNATYLLGNVWFDFHNHSRFTPYVGGGVGLGWASFQSPYVTFNQNNSPSFAFQLGAGVNFDLNDRVSIDVGYRYKDIVGLKFNPEADGVDYTDYLQNKSLASHNFQVGVTFKF